ncbi:MAG: TetR/AcrR family transcriptional regulator [Fusobacteriaceae bacterium]|nr:TetR/AcrR family transcriptional regulator [Fusobacteriaceae bacterium]
MKKQQTLNKIIDTSISIFSRLPYEEVALSQICIEAEISNGTIYNYFKSKEEIFKFLLEETCVRLEKAFSQISGNNLEEKLKNFIEINLYMAKKEYDLIKIYREGQYKFIEYEQKLRKIYISAIENIYNTQISGVQYLYIMSGIRFINVVYTTSNLKPNIDFLSKIILNGIFNNMSLDFSKLQDQTLYTIIPFNPNNRKTQLLHHGEKLFGEYGYNNVKIIDITKNSNMAIGTFYNYFEKKEQFLEEITTQLSNSILFFLDFNSKNITNLLEKHINYLFLLIAFFEKSPYRYQIIRESEFVSSEISKEYFNNLENLYLKSFEDTDYDDEQKKLLSNFLIGISHYMGIELFFTKNIAEKTKVLEQLSYYLINGTKNII